VGVSIRAFQRWQACRIVSEGKPVRLWGVGHCSTVWGLDRTRATQGDVLPEGPLCSLLSSYHGWAMCSLLHCSSWFPGTQADHPVLWSHKSIFPPLSWHSSGVWLQQWKANVQLILMAAYRLFESRWLWPVLWPRLVWAFVKIALDCREESL